MTWPHRWHPGIRIPDCGRVAALRRLLERVERLHVDEGAEARLLVAGDRRRARRHEAGGAQEIREEGAALVRLLSARPTGAAHEIFAWREPPGCRAVVRDRLRTHRSLATALLGTTLAEYDVRPTTYGSGSSRTNAMHSRHLGISLDVVRSELEDRLGDDVWSQPCGLAVTPEAKRMLDSGRRDAGAPSSPDQMLAALIEHSTRMRRLLFELGVPVGTLRNASDVEADVQDVAVLDDVRLALEPLLARARRPRRASRARRGRPSGSPRSG